MIRILLCILLAGGFVFPVQAQPAKAKGAVVTWAKNAQKKSSEFSDVLRRGWTSSLVKKANGRFSPQADQHLLEALRQAANRDLRASVLQVVSSGGEVLSSGFIFKESYAGQEQLWAVVPYHVAGRAGKQVSLRLYKPDGSFVAYTGKVRVGGGYGINSADISLVSLPAKMGVYVQPLPIASRSILPRTQSVFYGYPAVGGNEMTVISNNQLLHAQGFKIAFANETPLELSGACGSPFLNKKGEVLGIFSGQIKSRAVFAVDVSAVGDLLKAYRSGFAMRALRVLGVEVGSLNVTETLGTVSLVRGGLFVDVIDVRKYIKPFDYGHLEQLFAVYKGDILLLSVLEHGVEKRQLTVRIK